MFRRTTKLAPRRVPRRRVIGGIPPFSGSGDVSFVTDWAANQYSGGWNPNNISSGGTPSYRETVALDRIQRDGDTPWGTPRMKCVVQPGDDPHGLASERNEIGRAVPAQDNPSLHPTVYWGFSKMVPAGYAALMNPSGWSILTQSHVEGLYAGSGTSPPAGFSVNPLWCISCGFNTGNAAMVWRAQTRRGDMAVVTGVTTYELGATVFGQWEQFIVRNTFSRTAGTFQIWRRSWIGNAWTAWGAPRVNLTNTPTVQYGTVGGATIPADGYYFQKEGQYRNESPGRTDTTYHGTTARGTTFEAVEYAITHGVNPTP